MLDLIFPCEVIVAYRLISNMRATHRRGGKLFTRQVSILFGLFLLLASEMSFLLLWRRPLAEDIGAAAYWIWLLPHTNWVLLVIGFSFLAGRQQRKTIRTKWEGQPSFHRAKTAEITAAAVTVMDAVTRTECRWEAFVRTEETKNLFLLATSSTTTLIFPKRAFSSEELLSAMRALMLAAPANSTGGFAVVPTNPTPVPAALPPELG